MRKEEGETSVSIFDAAEKLIEKSKKVEGLLTRREHVNDLKVVHYTHPNFHFEIASGWLSENQRCRLDATLNLALNEYRDAEKKRIDEEIAKVMGDA